MVRFLISSVADKLSAALASFGRTATVEAEYGDAVVEGSVLTLAHHGPRSANPAPCLAENGVAGEGVEAVGLSHLDLDSLGGCAAIIGRKPEAPGFWALAAFVDVNGVHKLAQSGADVVDIRFLNAYYAWAETHKVFAPRDGGILDVTDKVTEGIDVLQRILREDNPGLLTAGDNFIKKEDDLNRASFVEAKGGVIVRVSGGFTNHLYVTPDGKVCRAVTALRTDFHACTVSFADPIKGATCRDIVQTVWTDKDDKGQFLAGGHATIAGGPRGKFNGLDDLLRLRDATVAALAAADKSK